MNEKYKKFGRIRDDKEAAKFVASLQYPRMRNIARMMRPTEKKTVSLWEPLLKVEPSWKRGQQAIGDCVSWGAELAATCLLAQQAILGDSVWEGEAATESIYGGCRVEVNGGRSPLGNEDGAMGSWAAKWLKDWGVLLRKDYSVQTGNKEHDLSVYSGRKAKDWGTSGCGGRSDKEALDNIARNYPVQEVTLVSSVEELEAALLRGCPVTVASGVGYEGRRDRDGIIHANGSWGHQMCYWGISYTPAKEPLFDLCNSWGDMAFEGPYPGVDNPVIQRTSWRVTPKDAQRQLNEEDSYAFSRVAGFDLPSFDWSDGGLI